MEGEVIGMKKKMQKRKLKHIHVRCTNCRKKLRLQDLEVVEETRNLHGGVA